MLLELYPQRLRLLRRLVYVSLNTLRMIGYNPDWRQTVNLEGPAAPFLTHYGAEDVEYEF